MPWHSVDNTKTTPGDNTLIPSESVTDFGQKGREVEPNRTLSSTLQTLDWKKQYGGKKWILSWIFFKQNIWKGKL